MSLISNPSLPESARSLWLLLSQLFLHLFCLWYTNQDLKGLLQIPLRLDQRLLRDGLTNFEFGYLNSTVIPFKTIARGLSSNRGLTMSCMSSFLGTTASLSFGGFGSGGTEDNPPSAWNFAIRVLLYDQPSENYSFFNGGTRR
jgi:hypothetical protein